MVFNFHYCAGKLKSVSLFKVKDCCKSKGKANKCCKNKTVVLKVKDSHENAAKQLLPNKPISDTQLAIVPVNTETPKIFALEYNTFISNAPPHFSSTPTYLLNKVFRI